MRNKIFGSVCFVIGIIIIVTTGTSFAYFTASANGNGDITGETYNFDVDLNFTTVYQAEQLVPLSDGDVSKAIAKSSNKCIDSKGYDACSLYSLTLVNKGDAMVLNGYVITDNTTYTTDNLKYQIFDSNYTAVTDVNTISKDKDGKVYFTKASNNVSTQINDKDVSYYLVIWLTETGKSQNDDYSKAFSGKVGFESIYGDKITANFGV